MRPNTLQDSSAGHDALRAPTPPPPTRRCDAIQIRGCPPNRLPTPNVHLGKRESAAFCGLVPDADAAGQSAQRTVLLKPCAVLPNRLVRGALDTHADDNCEGQAHALQKRRLSFRPWAALSGWLGNTRRRTQKRLCLCGSADTWMPAPGREPTPLQIGAWSRGLSHSARASWQHCVAPLSPRLRDLFRWNDGQPWQHSAEHWATRLHAVFGNSTGVSSMGVKSALLAAPPPAPTCHKIPQTLARKPEEGRARSSAPHHLQATVHRPKTVFDPARAWLYELNVDL